MTFAISPQKPQGTSWAGRTFYLATYSKGRISIVVLPAGGQGWSGGGGRFELGMAVRRVGWGLGMLSKPQGTWPRHGRGRVVPENPAPHTSCVHIS